MGIDSETERRKAGVPIEKWIGVLLTGTALAFGFYEATGAYLDGIRTDIEQLARDQAVLIRELEFARAETSSTNRRLELVESKCAEIRERVGSQSRK
jgi:hypothetical protein